MPVNANLRDAVASGGGRIQERFDGVRIDFPNRPARRKAGAAFAGMGAGVTLFMILWMNGPISGAWQATGAGRWFMLAFGCFGLLGLIPGLVMLAGGVALMAGRTRSAVDINEERIASTEYIGPLHWTFRLRWDRLAGIRLLGLPWGAGDALVLKSRREKQKPLVVGGMYPRSLIQPLYEELAARSGRPLRPAVEWTGDAGIATGVIPEESGRAERPEHTAIALQEFEGGCAFHIPPAGLRKGSKGLFPFSLIWLTFCSVIFGAIAFGGGRESKGADAGIVLLFALVFIGIGVALLLFSIHMGRRRALVVVAHGHMGVRQYGPWGKRKEIQVPAGELSDIRVGPSGMEVNNRPVMELQLIRTRGRKIGCLSQLRDDELAWMAGRLRGFALRDDPAPPVGE